MNPQTLRIKSNANDNEYYCQKIYVTGAPRLGGQLECADIVQLPPANDRIFRVLPLNFEIQIIDNLFESKKPSFIVK